MRRTYVFLLVVGLWNWSHPVDAVDFAAIEFGPVKANPTVRIPAGQGTDTNESLETEGFFLDPGALTGEFPLRIGNDWEDDAVGGVLLGYVYEIGRTVGAETIYSTASTVLDIRGGAGGLSLTVRRAGEDTPGSAFNGDAPFNTNLMAAYFPFNQGWVGGTALTSDDAATFDEFVGSPELKLGNVKANFWGQGPHLVTIPGVQDTRRQGFVFATNAANEDVVALVSPTSDGAGIAVSTIVTSQHGGPDTPGSFQFSPFSFLFIPRGTPNMTMGRIYPSDGPDLEPAALISSGSDFTISREDAGLFRLSIVGGSPRQGALLVSPHGANDGAGGRTDDNIIQYQPDGDDWLILSQDLPALAGIGQDAAGSLTYFDFAYLPFESPPQAPGPVPPLADLTSFSKSRMFAYSAQVIQNSQANGPGSIHQVLTGGPSDLAIQPVGSRGDLTIAVDGGFVSVDEGVLIPTVTEGYRENGRVVGYGLIGAGEADGELQVFTAAATPTYRYNEHNVNYAAAFFGADSGFEIGNHVPIDEVLELSIDGVTNAGDEGVLIVVPFGKEDRFATAGPRADGSGWDIELRNSDTALADGDINYVYLPFETEDLVAGRIDTSGDTLASTGEDGFTLTKEDIGTYRLSIPDKSAETGMLLLTGLGSTAGIENEDNYLVYQPDGNDFLILGLDMVTIGQATGGEAVEPEDTAFAFAYIDFDPASVVVPPVVGIDSLCLAFQAGGNSPVFDINGDGVVNDGDLTAFLESAQRLPGDANFDGEVQFGDFVTLAENFGQLDALWSEGDFTCDSQVQFGDFVVLANNFGKSPSAGQVQAAAVPEPSSLVLLLGCAVVYLSAIRRLGRV